MKVKIEDLKKVIKQGSPSDSGSESKSKIPNNVEIWPSSEDNEEDSNEIKSGNKRKPTEQVFDEDIEGMSPTPCEIPSTDPTYKPVKSDNLSDKERKDAIKKIVRDSLENAKARGLHKPGDANSNRSLSDIEYELSKSITNWKTILRKFISQSNVTQSTWAKPSKRSISAGYYGPGRIKVDHKLDLYVCIDTSGSMSKEQIGSIFSEIIALGKTFTDSNINLILWHHEVYAHVLLSSGTATSIPGVKTINLKTISDPNRLALALTAAGKSVEAGGTIINCINNHLKQMNATPIGTLIFTDGVVFDNPIVLPKSKNGKMPIVMLQNLYAGTETQQLINKFTRLGATVYLIDV